MKINTLHDCLVIKLKALADIEKQIIKALPKIIKNAESEDLKDGLREHLEETRVQEKRLEDCFRLLGVKPGKIKVEAIRGLVEDAEWAMGQDGLPAALDSMIIAGAQYVEHYEMAGYQAAFLWADLMGHAEVAQLLEQSLREEEKAWEKLDELAEIINQEANMMIEE